MKIGFFTWGDAVMGMGHVFRCLALAREARRQCPGLEVAFEMRERQPGLNVVAEAGESVTIWPDDQLPRGWWDILVVDQLQVAPELLDRLRPCCRCLVSLDDAGPGHWSADLAVSTLYRCRAPRPPHSGAVVLDGLEYTLIDPAFAARPYAVRPQPRALFLTQGGSDTWNMLSWLVTAMTPWLRAHPATTLHVHTGPAFTHHQALERAVAESGLDVVRHGRVADLGQLMAGMDLAVAAGGVMTLELLACGVPCITVSAEEKELETISALARRGLVHNLGGRDDGLTGRLEQALALCWPQAARQTLSERARACLDGGGGGRIITAALELAARATRTKGPQDDIR